MVFKARSIATPVIFLLWAAQAQAVEVGNLRLDLSASFSGTPTSIAHSGDERLFIALKDGRIVIFENGALRRDTFLDIRGRVDDGGGEQGLLGLAFHPNYAQNGFFYVTYNVRGNDLILSRFAVSGDPSAASASSERRLLRIEHPFFAHNGGQLQFGPDGYLYMSSGDGGNVFDPQCNGQNLGTLLGGMLRLDVDQNIDQEPYYGVPSDNPFVDDETARPEIYAYGLRNPWRFSFDRERGDMFIADVGQFRREEINRLPASSPGGENFGWKMMEGTRCTGETQGCGDVPACNAPEYTAPIIEYTHDDGGCAVTGGYVYRGRQNPALDGAYFYGDFCTGQIFAAVDNGGEWTAHEIPPRLTGLTTFGEGADGELYLAKRNELYRLATNAPADCVPGTTVMCLNRGRFAVEATWRTADASGTGQVSVLSDESGYFWFFSESNAEMMVKVLDGCATGLETYWVFAAGLTNVEVTLKVTDSTTGAVRTYVNPAGAAFEPIQDVEAFASCP